MLLDSKTEPFIADKKMSASLEDQRWEDAEEEEEEQEQQPFEELMLDCARFGEDEVMQKVIDRVKSDLSELSILNATGGGKKDDTNTNHESPKTVKDLGYYINYMDDRGNTPLHMACANGHLPCIKILLLNDAKHLSNHQGSTPLNWAILNEQIASTSLLLSHFQNDIDVLAPDSGGTKGKSLLSQAYDLDDAEIIRAILNHPSCDEDKMMNSITLSSKEDTDNTNTTKSDVGEVSGKDKYNKNQKEQKDDAVIPKPTSVVHKFCLDSTRPDVYISVRELAISHAEKPFGDDAESDSTGLGIWAASVILARWLIDSKNDIFEGLSNCSNTSSLSDAKTIEGKDLTYSGRTVLELGSGCGLPGLAVAKYFGNIVSKVIVSDWNEESLSNLRYNVNVYDNKSVVSEKNSNTNSSEKANTEENSSKKNNNSNDDVNSESKDLQNEFTRNKSEIDVIKLDWDDETTYPSSSPVDMIIGSDLIYARTSLNPLKKVVSRNLKVGGKMYYIAPTTDRDGGGCVDITQSMVEAGLELVKEPFTIPNEYKSNCLMGESDNTFILYFSELMYHDYLLYEFIRRQ